MLKSKKGMAILELLIGMTVITIIITAVVMTLNPFVTLSNKSEDITSGDIYKLAYDIQKNKMYAQRSIVTGSGTILTLERSPTCKTTYTFVEEDKQIKKDLECTPQEVLEIDSKMILDHIEGSSIRKSRNTIFMDINTTDNKYMHSFAF